MEFRIPDKWEGIDFGDTRVVSKFLLFPKCIGRDCKWLVRASYLQECVEEMNYGTMDYNTHKEWRDIKWL